MSREIGHKKKTPGGTVTSEPPAWHGAECDVWLMTWDPRVTIFVTHRLFVNSPARPGHSQSPLLAPTSPVLKGSISYIETLPVWKQNILEARSFVTSTQSYLPMITSKSLHILPHHLLYDRLWMEWLMGTKKKLFWIMITAAKMSSKNILVKDGRSRCVWFGQIQDLVDIIKNNPILT